MAAGTKTAHAQTNKYEISFQNPVMTDMSFITITAAVILRVSTANFFRQAFTLLFISTTSKKLILRV